jgi:hypothetical protein
MSDFMAKCDDDFTVKRDTYGGAE